MHGKKNRKLQTVYEFVCSYAACINVSEMFFFFFCIYSHFSIPRLCLGVLVRTENQSKSLASY